MSGLRFAVVDGIETVVDALGRDVMLDGSPVDHLAHASLWQAIAATSHGWALYAMEHEEWKNAVLWQAHATYQYRVARHHHAAALGLPTP